MDANSLSSEVTCVTGVAGFIGFHVARRLIEMERRVVGIDIVNDYYDVTLKEARLTLLASQPLFHFERADVAEPEGMRVLFARHSPSKVIHLAAQAGVRYSLEHPQAYVRANLTGFVSILEACRHSGVAHLTYASSSSVYGANKTMPFSVHDNIDHPLSLYAATKKANELMAHTYSHLFQLPTTGLRFFTVYGPWGRPDMAMFIFTKAILEGRPISLFNRGNMRRDFTYIDDIVTAVIRTSDRVAAPNLAWRGEKPDPGTSLAPYRIYNIGNNSPVDVTYVVSLLEQELGRKAERIYLGMQPGDVPATCADIEDLSNDVGFRPSTSIEEGVKQFVAWYKEYYGE
ncbi:MAG TPA: NAD-dependent epimerase [Pyrinomonadaceae bacterium]|nr:NAD-dependent epimerase [Pyrinomonadaceae bacterium]